MSTRFMLQTADGHSIPAHLFRPQTPARAAVVIAGAYAVPQGFYARFASWLTGQGFAVLTFDYRGIGEARPDRLRGYRATAQDWGRHDLSAALAFLHRTWPEQPRFLIGHSFGGQALGMADGVADLSGALILATGFATRWQHSGVEGLKLYLQIGLLVPLLTATMGYLPAWSGLGEDVPAGAILEWRRWLLSPNYLLDHLPDARVRFAEVGGPVRIVRFTDDELLAPAAVDLMRQGLPQAEVTVIEPAQVGLETIGHFGFFRPRCASLWPLAVEALSGWQAAA